MIETLFDISDKSRKFMVIDCIIHLLEKNGMESMEARVRMIVVTPGAVFNICFLIRSHACFMHQF